MQNSRIFKLLCGGMITSLCALATFAHSPTTGSVNRHHASTRCHPKRTAGRSPRNFLRELIEDQQQTSKPEPRIFHANINEDAKLGLVGVAADAGDPKIIIIIAHRGARESRVISRRRLRTARDYLRYTHGVAAARVVTAEGAPVRGPGRLDVYIDGKQHSTFAFFKRNRDFAPEP